MAWQWDWARDAWHKRPAHPRRGACMARGVLSQRESVLRHVDDGAGRPVKRNERDGPCERWRAPALASASDRLGSCPRLISVAAHVEKGVVALEVVESARKRMGAAGSGQLVFLQVRRRQPRAERRFPGQAS